MNTDRWRQLETIVAAALELNGEQRVRYVADACGEDRGLRAEVEDLLGGETGAERMLGDIEFDASNPEDRLLGSTIGPYRLESLLGSGGMGVVYLVRRTDGEFDQKAALKVIRGWMMGDQLRQRFLAERQVLASLDHPGIARLLDGGTTPEGTPYLVMEHIDGVPIDRYCDEHELDVGERIRLFLKICESVTFAHRNLVVHRDIKPANILVDNDGTPKLLDFGIAKILDPSSFPVGQTATRTGSRPMSPVFASPEHIRGQSINTASDVYSLGAVLYTLLTGRPPRILDDYTPRSLERAISKAPWVPSDAVAETEHAAPSRRRQLRGDLDAILLKALREEPEHRYPSADELARDLQRNLD